MARAKIPTNADGPVIRGVDPWAPSAGKMRQYLSAEERARLAVLSSIVRLNKGEEIYREGQHTDTIQYTHDTHGPCVQLASARRSVSV